MDIIERYEECRKNTKHRPGTRCTYKGRVYEVDSWPRLTQPGDGWHVYGTTTWVVKIRPVNPATNRPWQGAINRPVSQVVVK